MSLPIADHTLLLYLAQLVMMNRIEPPSYADRYRHSRGRRTTITIEVDHALLQEWINMKNAPYGPDINDLYDSFAFAEAACVYWAEYADMMKNEITERTKGPVEPKTRSQMLADHVASCPIHRFSGKQMDFLSTMQFESMIAWVEHLKKLVR